MRTLVIRLRREYPRWGVPKIQGALRELGIQVSKSTVRNILVEEGLLPSDPRPANWDRFRSAAKDALWAIDFFVTETRKGVKVKVLLIIDVYTRELMDLRVHDGWAVDSQWTTMSLNTCIRRTWRMPDAIVHDREPVFDDQLTRQLAVLGIERRRTPARKAPREHLCRARRAHRALGATQSHPRERRRGAAVVPGRVSRLV